MAHRVKTNEASAEDVMSVGTRISWGAIFAGAMLALAIQFLLSLLGGAVGVAVSDRVDPGSLRTGALIWAVVTICAAVFMGGMITALFTVGENKVEAVIYGVIMWAVMITMILGLGAAGMRTGLSAMIALASVADKGSAESWETAMERAGFSKERIEEIRKSFAPREEASKMGKDEGAANPIPPATPSREEMIAAGKKITWYAFAGAWISMIAAAAGALVGAGPTFRLVRVVP